MVCCLLIVATARLSASLTHTKLVYKGKEINELILSGKLVSNNDNKLKI